MKFIHYIYSTLLLTLLSACQGNEVIRYVYSVGEADNAIVLSAGISEGGEGVTTRAVANPDVNHATHVALSEGTIMRLRVDGDWWKSGESSATEVKKITDATAGDVVTSTNDKHRKLKDYSPQLYWDDYGTADPSNTVSGKGREKGLNIYGATVNGQTTLPDALKNNLDATSDKWKSLAWNVGKLSSGTDPAINQTSGWVDYDLLTSNNVVYSSTADQDNAYKFSEHTAGKLLEFTHAMTKITVNLTAADGFPLSGIVPQFQSAPTVTLLGFNYTGNVNVESKNSTPTTSTTTNIQAHFANFIETSAATEWTAATSTWTKSNKTQFDALVFPGNSFADATDIIKINCDGNIYYVNATKINAAMNTAGDTDKAFKQGKNYIFNITVKKTKIEVTATIKGWEDVEAETVQPLININAQVGTIGATDVSLSAFEFYMSTTKAGGYTAYGNATGTADGTTKWQFKDGETNISLFWPTHNTHYFMRGVSPTTTTVADNKQIAVVNGAYNSLTSPSNLMIGAPEIADNTMCGNDEHTQVDMSTTGICARNNTINLNFRYVMSQVEVRLKSSGTDEKKNKVTIDNNTTVEIIGGYNQARIQLGTRLHDDYTDSDKNTSYSMNVSSETPTGFSRVMHDIIVPQALTDDMQFKITVKNADGTTDVYYAQLNKIKVKKADGSGEFITEWKPDEHYIYELDIIKTEINVTATLTDWNTVDASQPIWF